jgi:hypothetical protein
VVDDSVVLGAEFEEHLLERIAGTAKERRNRRVLSEVPARLTVDCG